MKTRFFTIDKNNRLALTTPKGTLAPNGRFSTDRRNRLIYLLNEPASWKKKYDAPSRIISEGRWSLSKDHDLVLRYRASENHGYRSLVFKGNIIKAKHDAFVFEVAGSGQDNRTAVQLITLNGYWRADKDNRIEFIVKNKPDPDTLTLGSNWKMGDGHQLIYTFEKRDLASGKRKELTLSFKGHWRIDDSRMLTYILGENPESRFDFRAQLETPTLYPKPGAIRYRVGTGFRRDSGFNEKIITLYGEWKFGRERDLFFNVDYGERGLKKIAFTYSLLAKAKNEVILSLANSRFKPLGISLTLNRFFIKKSSGKLFLRLKDSEVEKRIEAGVSLTF